MDFFVGTFFDVMTLFILSISQITAVLFFCFVTQSASLENGDSFFMSFFNVCGWVSAVICDMGCRSFQLFFLLFMIL